MSDITVINDSEQSSLVTNGLAKNGELYLKASGSTDEGAIVVYDSGSWRTFANEGSAFSNTYSVSFDGSNDYMDTGSTFQSTIRGGFTYSFWMKWSSLGSGSYSPFGSWDDSAGQNTVYISNPAANGALNYRLKFGSATMTLSTAAPTGGWNTSDWSHIAISVQQDGSNVAGKSYINGILKSSLSVLGTLNNFTSVRSMYIGARNRTNGSNIPFPGLVDEVAIFGSALSDGGVSNGQTAGGDIATLYNSGTPDDISSYSPVGWWRMGDNDSGTGTTITDQGSGSNDGTLTNGPTFSSSVPS